MRRYALLGLGAALGLAVAAPTWAQSPEDPARGLPTHVHVGRLCDACAKKMPKRVPVVVNSPAPVEFAQASVVAPAGCAACEASASGLEAPGIAHVGPHGPAAGQDAAGFASIGGPAAQLAGHGDPAPIGVMRTNYSVPSAASPYPAGPAAGARPMAGAPAGARPMAGPGAGAIAAAPGQAQGLIPPPSPDTGKKRPWVLGAMLGIPRRSQFNAYQREVDRSNHAMTRYDSAEPGMNSLPASAVYGH